VVSVSRRDRLTHATSRDRNAEFGRIKPPAGKAGEKFAYNNSNYLLCRSIIENISGISYADFMMQNIWKPLGMDHTQISASINPPRDSEINADNFYDPDGGIYSTAGDLFRFAQALQTNKLVNRESVEEAFSRPRLNDGSNGDYGFGWYILETPESKSAGHWGGGEWVKAYLELYLTEEKTLIMLTVHSTSYADKTYRAIRNIWEGKPYELPAKISAYNIDPELYKEYVGSYLTPNMGLLHVSIENQKLYLRPNPIPGKEELIPSSDSTFYFSNQDLQWQFYRDGSGEVIGFGIKGDRENIGIKQN
jgi:CubicO group peptidase (beta-lactamase class C family)